MAFNIINKSGTILSVKLRNMTVTLKNGEKKGPYRESQRTQELRLLASRNQIGVETIIKKKKKSKISEVNDG